MAHFCFANLIYLHLIRLSVEAQQKSQRIYTFRSQLQQLIVVDRIEKDKIEPNGSTFLCWMCNENDSMIGNIYIAYVEIYYFQYKQ